MKKNISTGLITLILFFIIYLFLPTPGLPPPPPGSLVSPEPADTESIYRNAYYTQLSRSEIMKYYRDKYSLAIRLNHPPEESFAYIRDQTFSSWLEELVNPWKDSLYINGFYPTKPTEQINYGGTHYLAKITLHYFPSSLPTRFTVLGLALISSYFLIKEYAKT